MPFCGMNAMWRREAIPLSYHLLMGRSYRSTPPSVPRFEADLTTLPFDRFGDIWCGIIQKRICDHLGWIVSSGTPYIHHDRASDPFANLRKEANGIAENETFWERIDSIDISGVSPRCAAPAAMCYGIIADQIGTWKGEHMGYWDSLGRAMRTWASLFTD